MNESLLTAVREALSLLVTLREERAEPEEAQASFFALKQRHPDVGMDLVWEQEAYEDTFHYDVLVEGGAGTLSLSYCADEELPWAVRGIQRVNESLVLRVNGAPVRIAHAITSLDYAWHTLHIGRHLIHMSIIDQETRARGIEVSDAELSEALLRFRRQRRLFSVAQVERWLVEHGTTQVQLEGHLRDEVAREKLKRQVVAGREEAYFQQHRADFERAQVVRLSVEDKAEALRLHERLRGTPGQLLSAAQARFLEQGASSELFVTLERGALDAEQAALVFSTEPGQLAEPVPSGDGYALVQVLRFLPARLDEATRERIASLLFDAWLEEQRRVARVEWFWGAADAAPLPAMSL